MQQQTTAAVGGLAGETAQAVQSLSAQTAEAVSRTAATAEHATSSLETRTAQAFSQAEGHLENLQRRIDYQNIRIDQLTSTLTEERRIRRETEDQRQQAADRQIASLTKQLNAALSRIDEMSPGMAASRSAPEPSVALPVFPSTSLSGEPQTMHVVPYRDRPRHADVAAPIDMPKSPSLHSHHSR